MNTLLANDRIKSEPLYALRQGLSAVAALSMIFDAPDLDDSLQNEDCREGVRTLMEASYRTLRAAHDVLDEDAADEFVRQKHEAAEQDAFNRRADAWMRLRGSPVKEVADCMEELRRYEASGASGRFEAMWRDVVSAFATGAKNERERGIDRDELDRRVREGLLKTREFTALRNAGIVNLWRAGASFQDIATQYELYEKAVERICRDAERDRINDPFASGMTTAAVPQTAAVAECDRKEQEGPVSAPVTRNQTKAWRNRRNAIIKARMSGESPAATANRLGLSHRYVRDVCSAAKKGGVNFPPIPTGRPAHRAQPAPALTEAAPADAGLSNDSKARA